MSIALPGTTLTSSSTTVPPAIALTTTEPSVNALIEAEGNLFLNAGPNTYGLVELRLVVDGAIVRTLRTSVINTVVGSSTNGWHLHTLMPLTPGTHDVHVEGRTLSTTGSVIANSTTGRLTVVLLRP